jgi:transcriptional regulator with XRE-family HTH domain
MNPVLEARIHAGLTRKQIADELKISDKLVLALELGADAIITDKMGLTSDKVVEIIRKMKKGEVIP